MVSVIRSLVMVFRIIFVIISLFILVLLCSSFLYSLSYAQWIIPPMPMPASPTYTPNCCSQGINRSDTTPPKIIILTDTLYEGNNVLKLKILDESPLKMRAISYSMGNHSITTYLAKEHDNEYRALLKVLPPSSKVEVTAIDLNDNYAKFVKDIKVEKGFNSFFFSITNSSIWKNLFSGDKKH
jgi:hypothetical protein